MLRLFAAHLFSQPGHPFHHFAAFVQLCVLSGCDYIKSLRGVGLKTALKAELVPLPSTQNHKLVYPLFPRKEHVLVVEVQQQLPSDCVRQAVVSRALKGEKVLHVDLSKGGEPIPIPVFNGADDDTSGMDFT